MKRPRPTAVLAAAMAFGALLLLWQNRGQTFFADEWAFFANYRHQSALTPDSGNLVVVGALLYKALLGTFGAGSYLPWRVLSVAMNLLCAGLFFGLARRRAGDWLALGPAILLIFLGAAWDVVISPLGITPMIAIAAGLGALLALERSDRRGDLAACVLLAVSLGSYSSSIGFAAGAVVWLALLGGPNRLRRSWVVAAPLLLYAAWRIWAIQFHQVHVTLANVGNLPFTVDSSLSAALATVTGLFRPAGVQDLAFIADWARPLSILLVALLVARLLQPRPMYRRFWVFLAMPLAYWLAIALAIDPLRSAEASRYQLPGAVFLLLLTVELCAGLRFTRAGAVAFCLVLGGGLTANLVNLHYAANALRVNAIENRAELTVVELERTRVPAIFPVEALNSASGRSPDLLITAGNYLGAADAYGSPAYPLAQLARAPEIGREAADLEALRALAIAPMLIPRLTGCSAPDGGRGQPAIALRVRPGGLALRTGDSPVRVSLKRFADGFAPPLAALPPRSRVLIAIPRDAAKQPWQALIQSAAPVSICAPR
jgi:hypothetical protein